MTKRYNILWIDDKHEELGGFKLQAAQNDIVLNSFKSRNAGIAELIKNYPLYDGVLFDAKFFEDEDDEAGSEDLGALNKARESLLQLPKKFEMFVLTGQAELFEDKTFNTFFPKYFRKGIANDIYNLFSELKQSADKQIDTQIRHKYSRVFDVCTKTYIGEQASYDLLTILKNESFEIVFDDSKLYFNPLRKIMDDLFIACNKYGFMPDVFVKPTVALNESSKFLSGGIEKGYQLVNPVFPKVISDNVRNILSVCQPAAHRAEIDRFIAQVNSPYLLLSVTYQLLDVLLWFKSFAEDSPDVSLNKTKFKVTGLGIGREVVTGAVKKDVNRNFHCEDIILTYTHVSENGYNIGDQIRIIKSAPNTNERSKDIYKLSALQSEKI